MELDGEWRVKGRGREGEAVEVEGAVPGDVHSALLAARLLSDPYYRYNYVEDRWVALGDWTYVRSFSPTPSLLSLPHLFLVCYGMDTVSTISLNGHVVGTTDNQFRRYLFPIKEYLIPGENTLQVFISSFFPFSLPRKHEEK